MKTAALVMMLTVAQAAAQQPGLPRQPQQTAEFELLQSHFAGWFFTPQQDKTGQKSNNRIIDKVCKVWMLQTAAPHDNAVFASVLIVLLAATDSLKSKSLVKIDRALIGGADF